MTMTLHDENRSIQLEPWELITLRILLKCEGGFPPQMLWLDTFLYGVDSTNISSFLSYLTKTLQEFDIKTDPIWQGWKTKLSFDDLKRLTKEKSSDEIYKIVKSLIIFVDIGNAKEKIKNKLNQNITEFIEGKTWSLPQFEVTPYTYAFQKTNFLQNIPVYINKYGRAFKLFLNKDYQLFGDEKKKTNFTECLLTLEKEGLVDIAEISFVASTLFDDENIDDLVIDIKITDKLLPQKNMLPANWKLSEEGKRAIIKHGDKTVFTFSSNTSNQYRYFKCLWNKYGQRATYQDVYEFESNLKYPNQKGKDWKINDLIRNTVRKLKKQLQTKNVPIQIDVNRGFVLTVKTS
jgi:hypothetical protein